MNEAETVPPVDGGVIELVPFGFVPHWISRVAGLGGSETPDDKSYVFHTPYIAFGPDKVSVTVRFEGLTATRGLLAIRVGALPTRAGAIAYQLRYGEFPLWAMAVDKDGATLRFLPEPDTLYAVMGHVYNDTDAAATGITITAQRTCELEAEAERLASERRATFGVRNFRQVPWLYGQNRSSLADPVSQICTAAQLADPLYREWAGRLALPAVPDHIHWRQVYVLQALRRYSMLETSGRGIVFGDDAGGMPALLASMGCAIAIARPAPLEAEPAAAAEDPTAELPNEAPAAAETVDGGEGIDAWRRPDLCPDDRFDDLVSLVRFDPADLAESLSGYDFLWSQPDHDESRTPKQKSEFILASLACLNPGGIAIHTVAFEPRGDASDAERAAGSQFRRGDFERLALTLIGHGHEVAQLNYQGDDDAGETSFGIIVRRGLTT